MYYNRYMKSRSRSVAIFLSVLAACAPSANTGSSDADEIIDLIVNREAPFHGCVEVTSPTKFVAEYPANYIAPPGDGWNVNQFEDPKAVRAAQEIAVSFEEAMSLEEEAKILHLFGERDQYSDGCVMSVTYPAYSGEFAFAWFMEPGGDMGTYALERRGTGWHINERVFLAWW